MNGLRTAEDYERACGVVRSVIDTWDPYSLLKHGAPADEFEGLAASVVTHIPQMRRAEDAAEAVSQVFSEAFERQDFRPENCRKIGATLFDALQREGFVS